MGSFLIYRSLWLCKSNSGHLLHASEFIADKSINRSRMSSYARSVTNCGWGHCPVFMGQNKPNSEGRVRSLRMFCSNKNDTPEDNDGISELKNYRIPRRLLKRLQRQGITESQFRAQLMEVEESYKLRSRPVLQTQSTDDTGHIYEHESVKFSGSQKDLENLLRDMGPNKNSNPLNSNQEMEFFPSDMLKESGRKNLKFKSDDSKFKLDPSSTSILLFPGQGSQIVGMGKKLIHFPGVKDIYEEASSILGYDLLQLCLEGPKSELDKTIHCQPAVMITSIAALEKLREEHPKAIENCVATSGFSVGEFAALVFSGVLSLPDAIEVVKTRAEAMQKASERVSSGMLSVFLAHNSDLKSAMRVAKEYCIERRGIQDPVCQIANFMFPECKVIAGHTDALEFISANKKEFRLMRTKHLPVSGAFHTRLMDVAVSPLENVLKKIKIGTPKVPVYSNLTGQPYFEKSNFVHKLCQQMVQPVKWEQTMHNVYKRSQGVAFPQTFELGPSKQMGTLLKQVNLQAYKSYKCIEV